MLIHAAFAPLLRCSTRTTQAVPDAKEDMKPGQDEPPELMAADGEEIVETTEATGSDATSFAEAVEAVGAESMLGYRLQQQAILSDFGLAALKTRDLDELLDTAVRLSAEGMRAELCKILEYRAEGDHLLLRAGVGWHDGEVGSATLGADEQSPAGFAFRNGTPVISNHLEHEERFRTPRLLADHGVRRAINVLIATGEGAWGVLEVDSPNEGEFEAADIAFLQGFANLVGVAIERAEADRKLAHALEHQKLLVQEASHRVKNSLAMLSGLLQMQSRRAASADISQALDEASGRIIAVARTHDQLWRHGGSDRIELKSLMADLCATLQAQFDGFDFHCDADAALIGSDRAMTLALLVTELVTNAAKHGYAGGQGQVWTQVRQEGEGRLSIVVRDEGQGLPDGFQLASSASTSLGMKLITTLARSLGGTITARTEGGAIFELTMPL
jgi:two-component sensor histidine kinase